MFKMAVMSAVGTILLTAAPAGVETTQLQPFTNIAEIPVGSDLSSIRFEGIKAVKVATTRTSITDQRYCEGGYREPGGSMYCPSVQDGSAMPAYRITYSYNGPPLGSDEYGNAHFTFSVIVRPIGLSPTVLQMMSARKMNRAAAAEDFKVATSPGFVPRVVIDQANSVFCDGSYIDGLWTHTDRNCEDKVTLKTVATPSDYITVRVDPAASTANLSSASGSTAN
ncbi:MAG: hypothetical protein ABSG79_10620 [Bryobacteraceae bacterium]|jgi:hypothetical protein